HDGPEISTAEGMTLIRDLAAFHVPRLQFAGGEPLIRQDLLDFVAYAHEQGIQPTLLTNGTLLSKELATGLKRAGLHSVTILLEGLSREPDRRPGERYAPDAALEGYANCETAGLEAEVRVPLNRRNYPGLADFLDLVERQRIRRVVFAHLIYTGQGNNPQDDMTHGKKRHALDLIIERGEDFHRRRVAVNIATDKNHVDSIYLYMRLARRN